MSPVTVKVDHEQQAGTGEEVSSPGSGVPLLFLCHRLPYPPNKGDKIRAWHLLQKLAHRYDVYLGTFVDDPDDWKHLPTLKSLCKEVHALPLSPRLARVRSALGFLTGEALSIPYYANSSLSAWCKGVIDRLDIAHHVVFSSVMAQFLPQVAEPSRLIVDFVDVDSDKWRQYSAKQPWPLSAVYGREARRLSKYEVQLAQKADVSVFVSPEEASFFQSYEGVPSDRVHHVSNGVDAEYFNPEKVSEDRALPRESLVFTGAMDYWPNVDAVCWFALEAFPLIRREFPSMQFIVVGGKPTSKVAELAKIDGVTVTGRVADVRPYLSACTAAVAPMRIARGIQNKVLEAMAMAKPVLTTTTGLEGIAAEHEEEVLVANDPEDYVLMLRAMSEGAYGGIGDRARDFVVNEFSWAACLAKVDTFLGQAGKESQDESS